MAEIRTVTTLSSKRDEIIATIAQDEKRLAQARADLSHVNACIAIFEANDDPEERQPYLDLHQLFGRGEIGRLAKEALASGPKTTRELARHVMAAKGLDVGDKVLARAMASRMIHSLRQQRGRGLLCGDTKLKGAVVWSLPGETTG